MAERAALVAAPPRVAHANRYAFRPGEVVGPHASASELVLVAIGGAGRIDVGAESFALRDGMLAHVPWHAPIRYAADRARPLDVLGVHLVPLPWRAAAPGTPPHAARALDAGAASRAPRGVASGDAFAAPDAGGVVTDLARAIVDAFTSGGDERDARLRGLALLLAVEIRAARARAGAADAHPLAARVREACAWLERAHARPVRRGEIARRVGLGETALAEAFRAVTGRAPIDWLIDLRLAKARALLGATREPIAAVGAAVGIPDPYYFARLFRRRVGCSPRAWRARNGLLPR